MTQSPVEISAPRNLTSHLSGLCLQVTVFGQSSGGSSISALLASPLAAGLFHRTWVSSPLPLLPKDMRSASQDNLVLLNKTGCADLECLMSLTASDLIRASPWKVYWDPEDLFDLPQPGPIAGLTPVIDGENLCVKFDVYFCEKLSLGFAVRTLLVRDNCW